MYEIKVISEISAAHSLRNYRGKCEMLHGHNWEVEVSVKANKLDSQGMVMDFKELKSVLEKALSGLDHKYLNDVDYFKKVNPTSENIARFIHERISKVIKKKKIKVSVWETTNSCASFWK